MHTKRFSEPWGPIKTNLCGWQSNNEKVQPSSGDQEKLEPWIKLANNRDNKNNSDNINDAPDNWGLQVNDYQPQKVEIMFGS